MSKARVRLYRVIDLDADEPEYDTGTYLDDMDADELTSLITSPYDWDMLCHEKLERYGWRTITKYIYDVKYNSWREQ